MLKSLSRLNQKAIKYFKAHPNFNSFIHLFIGIGVGILIIPLIPGDQVWWGVGIMVIGILGHLVSVVME